MQISRSLQATGIKLPPSLCANLHPLPLGEAAAPIVALAAFDPVALRRPSAANDIAGVGTGCLVPPANFRQPALRASDANLLNATNHRRAVTLP